MSAIYELPFGRGKPLLKSGVPAYIAGGWQLSGIVNLSDGSPLSITTGARADLAATAARFYDVPTAKIASAFTSFSGIARRQELRGEAGGVKVIDDFGHHPTAIAQTLQALRHRFRGQRLWAVFEPRSNTTRRAVFQQQLPEALKVADGVFISQVARLEQIPEDQRLKPERVVAAIAEAGRPAFYEQNANAIVDRIIPMLRPKDVVVVFSNGGFDNIHEKLLTRLRA